MYIEIHDYKKFEQDILYFKLNNCLNMDTDVKLNYKFAGLYAIYKDELCLYVGQSRNLASRIATHLRGKYKNATNIYMWDISNLGYKDFHIYQKEIQEQILIKHERYLMSVLKPIDNIDINMDFIIYDTSQIPKFNFESSSSFTLQINEDYLQFTNSQPYFVEELILRLQQENLSNLLNELKPINDFYCLGVKNER